MHIGQIIRQKRQIQSISVRRLAKILEIDSSLLSRYETGSRNVSRNHVERIESYLKGDYDRQILNLVINELEKKYRNLTGRTGLELWNV